MSNLKDEVLVVPACVRFLTQWNDFSFNKFPAKCIINKQIPGCGMTEYCLLNPNENVIICSPRKMLMQNKKDQHGDDVFLVKNEMDQDPNVDKDISKPSKPRRSVILPEKTTEELENERKLKNSIIRDRIFNELQDYLGRKLTEHKPYKILVTYDSYHLIKKMLVELGIFHTFYTVIDEFQSILHDSRFKSDTEMRFMYELKGSPTALFVSATPMLKEYMEMLEDFKDLPYFELDWVKEDPTRVSKPKLDVRSMQSVGTKAREIIIDFLNGNRDSVIVDRNGTPTPIFANEIVLYVNSVNHILRIIKNLDLSADMVNILCSETDENKNRIKNKLGTKYSIGTIPKRGEYHKPITFCTRTVYLGADFYSTCAKSYVFSDSNIDSLAVDISEDLPQILGRQRLDENPWKNSATFYYRTTCNYHEVPQEEFDEIINKKKRKTADLISIYKNGTKTSSEKYNLAEAYQKVAKSYNYRDDYVAVNTIINPTTGDKILKPTENELVLVNEIRAFKIQQIDYKDRFSIFSTISNSIKSGSELVNSHVSDLISIYDTLKSPFDRLRLVIDYYFSGDQDKKEAVEIFIHQLSNSDYVKMYYTNLGPDRIKALSCNVTLLKKEMGIVIFDQDKLEKGIYFNFREGDKYSLSDLKIKLSQFYDSIGYKKTPKAIDINEFFETKEYKVTDIVDGVKKRVRGYELIKRLK